MRRARQNSGCDNLWKSRSSRVLPCPPLNSFPACRTNPAQNRRSGRADRLCRTPAVLVPQHSIGVSIHATPRTLHGRLSLSKHICWPHTCPSRFRNGKLSAPTGRCTAAYVGQMSCCSTAQGSYFGRLSSKRRSNSMNPSGRSTHASATANSPNRSVANEYPSCTRARGFAAISARSPVARAMPVSPRTAMESVTWVERNFGHAVARAYAGHTDANGGGSTTLYTRAGIEEVAQALSALTRRAASTGPARRTHRALTATATLDELSATAWFASNNLCPLVGR